MRHPQAGEPPFSIDRLYAGDCGDLAALHAEVFPRGWSESEFRGLLAGAGVFGLTVRVSPLAGFILSRVVADEAEVLSCGVAHDFRRQGMARGLLIAVLSEARSRGAERMFLEVAEDNHAALALYEGSGFFCVGRREAYYRGAETGPVAATAALVLRCNLCDAAAQANERTGAQDCRGYDAG
ncbi:MAG: GNAT family N-acetyltransferase [Dichotomicrobium sp.]